MSRLAGGLGKARAAFPGGPEALQAQQRSEQAGVLVEGQGGAKVAIGARAEHAGGPRAQRVAVDDMGALRLIPAASLLAAPC
eukprot:5923460-Pyramimonas_sp.AAC.1